MDNSLLPQLAEPDLLRIVVMINYVETFEFMVKCKNGVSLKVLKDKFQKSYDGIVKEKVIFKDKECSINAQLDLPALNAKEYFINFTQSQYQFITKSLFFSQKNAKSATKLPPIIHSESEKVEVANQNTAETKAEKAFVAQQVSSFEIKQEKVVPVQPQERREPIQTAKRPVERTQNELSSLKVFPETNNETTMNNISAAEYPPVGSAPVAESKSCCALI